MNICLTCREIQPQARGGLGRAMAELAVALAGEGQRVTLLTDESRQRLPRLPGVSVRALPLPRLPASFGEAAPESALHNLLYAAAVRREVDRVHRREAPVDAVLAPLWRSEGALCLLDDRYPTIVSCMTSLRTIASIDSGYASIADLDERICLERQTLLRSPYLHGLTQLALSGTINDFSLRPAATTVIGRGLGDRARSGARDGSGGAWGSRLRAATRTSRAVRILFVGRNERRKGFDTLLAAMARLGDDTPPFEVIVVGEGGYGQLRRSLAEGAADVKHLRGRLTFAGRLSDARLDRRFRACEIVCVPSRYESHSVVAVEAMMFGKAIVACAGGGIGEVIAAGRSGLLVEPDDPEALAGALRLAIADRALRERLGRAGRLEFERRFAAGRIAGQMREFIQGVADLHQRAAAAQSAAGGRERPLHHRRSARESGDSPAALAAGAPERAAAARMSARLTELLDSVLGIGAEQGARLAAELLKEADGAAVRPAAAGAHLRHGTASAPPAPHARLRRVSRAWQAQQDARALRVKSAGGAAGSAGE